MAGNANSPEQLNWAKAVYHALGWSFQDLQKAADEATKAKVQKEAAAKTTQDRLTIEKAVTQAMANRVTQDAEEKLSDIQQQLEELENDVKANAGKSVPQDKSEMLALIQEHKQLSQQMQSLYAHKSKFEDHQTELKAFEAAHKTAGELLKKAGLELKTHNTAGAQSSLLDAEVTIEDMAHLWSGVEQDIEQKKTNAQYAGLPDKVKDLAEDIQYGIKAMNKIGFTGIGTHLERSLKDVISKKLPPSNHAWIHLLDENNFAKDAVSEFNQLKGYISNLCISMRQSGMSDTPEKIENTLENYMHDASRSVATVRSLLNSLKAEATRKEKLHKDAKWDSAKLGKQTEKFREALKKIVRFDEDGNILTREDDSRAAKRAGDVPGLDQDVMIMIPRRKDKSVPRATMEHLLQSFDFLDELKATGVEGVEPIATEEFIHAEEILQGIRKNPGGYKQLTKNIEKLKKRIKVLSSGADAAYNIEERLRLSEEIDELQEASLVMPIDQALNACIDLEKQLTNLVEKVKRATVSRKLFEEKVKTAEGLFSEIPPLLAKVGEADPDLTSTFKRLFAADEAKQYHGDLDLQLDQAKELAFSATTYEDIDRAINLVNKLFFTTREFISALQDQIRAVENGTFDKFTDDQKEKLKDIAKDYQKGVKRMMGRKKAKQDFTQKATPLKEEIAMMTSSDISLDRIKAFYKGIDRVDSSKFDTTRLLELKAEIEALETACDASHSHGENMNKLKELESALDAMRGEITGFREDIAKDMSKFTDNCLKRLEAAKIYAESQFVAAVEKKQDPNAKLVDAAALKKFTASVAKPLVLKDLKKHVDIISDRTADLKNRKKAREDALRLVRTLKARLDGSSAVKLYMNHPFSDLPNDLNTLRPELEQLEVKLLSLAS